MNNSDLPASPTYEAVHNNQMEVIAWVPHGGLTKREAFAKAAMQGIITADPGLYANQQVAKWAVGYANALLAELAKGET